MNWLVDFLKIFRRRKAKQEVKTFRERESELGVFAYTDLGFTITHPEIIKTLSWSDINQINVYKTDLVTTDRIDMEIVYGKWSLTIHEELPGWYQFVIKTKEIFPTIPKDWDWEIVQPPFASNYRTIYTKNPNPPC